MSIIEIAISFYSTSMFISLEYYTYPWSNTILIDLANQIFTGDKTKTQPVDLGNQDFQTSSTSENKTDLTGLSTSRWDLQKNGKRSFEKDPLTLYSPPSRPKLNTSTFENFESKHGCRKSYLELQGKTPQLILDNISDNRDQLLLLKSLVQEYLMTNGLPTTANVFMDEDQEYNSWTKLEEMKCRPPSLVEIVKCFFQMKNEQFSLINKQEESNENFLRKPRIPVRRSKVLSEIDNSISTRNNPKTSTDTSLVIAKYSPIKITDIISVNDKVVLTKLKEPNFKSPSTSVIVKNCTPAGKAKKTSFDTPRKIKLKKKLKLKTTLLSRSKQRVQYYKSILPKTRANKIRALSLAVREFLTEDQQHFFYSQLMNNSRSRKGRRWSNMDKQIALSIFYQSPKTYKLLGKLFALPNPRTLRKWLEDVIIEPGFNDNIFQALQKKVYNMSPRNRNCVLLMDEISLMTGLSYNSSKDQAEGFLDNGKGDREKVLANEAFVIMLHGIFDPWKQVLSFSFARGTTNAAKMESVLKECLRRLQAIGLIVRAVIADQGPSNRSLFNRLKLSEEQPFFFCNGQKVYGLFDPPHLLKSLRNNFRTYLMKVFGKKVRFHHVEEFFKYDSTRPLRLAPKLKKKHIHPTSFSKMRVKDAAQVFSHTVSAAMSTCITFGKLEAEAAYTADFIGRVDKMFDAVNCSKFNCTKALRRMMTRGSAHHQVFEDSIKMLKSIEFELPNQNTRIFCIDGWLLSISSIKGLWNDLHAEGVQYLFTRRFTQDPLENYFCTIRQKGGNRQNPNALQFRDAFKQTLTQSFLQSSDTQNCENDFGKILLTLKSLKNKASVVQEEFVASDEEKTCLKTPTKKNRVSGLKEINANAVSEAFGNTVDLNALTYVTGSVIRKVRDSHKCESEVTICRFFTESESLDQQSQTFTHLKAFSYKKGDFGGLTSPSDVVTAFMLQIEKVFKKVFNSKMHETNILSKLVKVCEVIDTDNICPGFKRKIVYTYLKMRLYYSVIFINWEISEERERKKHEKKGKKLDKKLLKVSHLGC